MSFAFINIFNADANESSNRNMRGIKPAEAYIQINYSSNNHFQGRVETIPFIRLKPRFLNEIPRFDMDAMIQCCRNNGYFLQLLHGSVDHYETRIKLQVPTSVGNLEFQFDFQGNIYLNRIVPKLSVEFKTFGKIYNEQNYQRLTFLADHTFKKERRRDQGNLLNNPDQNSIQALYKRLS